MESEHVWIYDNPIRTPYEKKMKSILLKLLHNNELAKKGARNLGLFEFLKNHQFSNYKILHKNILLKKNKPFFKLEDSKIVWEYFNKQKGGALTKEELEKINKDGLKQLEEMKPSKIKKVKEQSYQNAPVSTELGTRPVEDTSRSAYDAIVDRWLKFWFALTPQIIKEPINSISPFLYPLKTLENIPVWGETLGLAVDVTAQMNKNIAKMAQMYTPMLMGFLPIPEASTVGIIVGYMISTIFIFFNMIIFTTRHHFGEAFKQSLALIPFVGMALENMADSSDSLLGRYGKARLKIIQQLKDSVLFTWMGTIIEWTTLDPYYEGDPTKDAEKIKGFLNEHIEKATKYGKELHANLNENLNNPEKRAQTLESLKQKAQDSIEQVKNSKLVQTLKDSTSKGLSTLGTAVEPPPPTLSEKFSRSIGVSKEGTLEKMRRKASETLKKGSKSVIGKQAGGKGLSNIKSRKSKWKTQRILKK